MCTYRWRYGYLLCALLCFGSGLSARTKKGEAFVEGLNQSLETFVLGQTRSLADVQQWTKRELPDWNHALFTPFLQKIQVADGTNVFVWGDIHGDYQALDSVLVFLREKGHIDHHDQVSANCYLVFLGDYQDRGNESMRVIKRVLDLKIKNPETVFVLRGNHEDLTLAQSYADYVNNHIERKNRYNYLSEINRMLYFYALPSNLPEKKQSAIASEYFTSAGVCNQSPAFTAYGYLWNDFDEYAHVSYVHPGRGLVLGQDLTRALVTRMNGPFAHVRCVVRGHQHSGSFFSQLCQSGFKKIWQGLVYTLMSVPMGCAQFKAAFARITVRAGCNWDFCMYRQTTNTHGRVVTTIDPTSLLWPFSFF